GGNVRSVVGDGDCVGDRVADIGRRVAHRLAHREVGLLRRGRFGGRVVAGVGVELVAVGDGGRIGLGVGGGDGRLDLQGGHAAAGDSAHGPKTGVAVVGSAGAGGDEGQTRREQVRDLYAGGVIGADVGEGDGEGNSVADVGRGVADGFGQSQVSVRLRHGD